MSMQSIWEGACSANQLRQHLTNLSICAKNENAIIGKSGISTTATPLGQLLPGQSSIVTITGDLRIQGQADKLRGFAAGIKPLRILIALPLSVLDNRDPEPYRIPCPLTTNVSSYRV